MRVVETFDEMRGLAGQEIGVSDWIEVDQERINTFAEATGADSLAALRDISAQDLLKKAFEGGGGFSPSIDGHLLSRPPGDVFSAGYMEEQSLRMGETGQTPAPEVVKTVASPVDLKSADSKRRYQARTKITKALAHPTRMQMLDALREHDVSGLDMPLTAEKIWRLLRG